jgi:nicotinamidase-related amidase
MMGVPVLCTEQYPKGLGPTMVDLRALLPEGSVIEKTSFGSMGEPAFRDALAATGRDQVVLCGTETHVCVLQTALGLRQAGHDVFMVADACGSRRPESEQAGLARARDAGCGIVTTEMVLFEWAGDKNNPRFKDIAALVR